MRLHAAKGLRMALEKICNARVTEKAGSLTSLRLREPLLGIRMSLRLRTGSLRGLPGEVLAS